MTTSALFTTIHRVYYGAVVPIALRSGPLERPLRKIASRLTARPYFMSALPSPVIVHGLRLHHDAQPSYTIRGIVAGTYERETTPLFRELLGPDMNVLDVGAHYGWYSLLSAQLTAPHGQIWAFEPDPANAAILERNASDNAFRDRVHIVPKAVSDTCGLIYGFRNEQDSGSTRVAIQAAGAPDFSAAAVALDDWARELGWPRIDLVKLDIEGAECRALAGMRELCRRNATMHLIVELNPDALRAAGDSAALLFARLFDLGFTRQWALGSGRRLLRDEDDRRAAIRLDRWRPLNLYCQRATADSS
jgi:FkbM family methyltransferase